MRPGKEETEVLTLIPHDSEKDINGQSISIDNATQTPDFATFEDYPSVYPTTPDRTFYIQIR